jgi:ABC-type xylose transport system permease subunit
VTTTAAPDLAEEFGSDASVVARIQSVLHKYPYLSPLAVLIAAMAVFTLLNERFIYATNLSLLTQQLVIVGTLAIAQTLIILTAGIDLSIGALMVFGQMVMANLAVSSDASNVAGFGWPSPLAIAVGLLIATAAGALNGVLITQINLPPFIVTLGTLSIFTALTLILFKARTIQGPSSTRARLAASMTSAKRLSTLSKQSSIVTRAMRHSRISCAPSRSNWPGRARGPRIIHTAPRESRIIAIGGAATSGRATLTRGPLGETTRKP